MPVPPLLVGPAAAAAAKAVAYEYLPAVSSASLAAVLARMAWNRIPEWIRQDLAFRKSSTSATSLQEMEHLSSVLEKLQSLIAMASEKLHQPVPHLYAALIAYVQLSSQFKAKYPNERNERYERSGEPLKIPPSEYTDIQDSMNFAIWAYYVADEDYLEELLEPTGFHVLQVNVPTKPGHVGHFVACNKETNTTVIGIKGTSSLEDIFTDTCGRSVSYLSHFDNGEDIGSRVEVRAQTKDEVSPRSAEFDSDDFNDDDAYDYDSSGGFEVLSGHERVLIDPDDESENHVRCHEGILISASRLAKLVQPLVHALVVRGGQRLWICGHSLGGGAASLLAAILRAQFPTLVHEDRIRVFAFAPPPVLDHDTSIAQSSFCTTIVNNSDLITRSSLANLAVFLEILRSVSTRLQERNMVPNSPSGAAAFWRKLTNGDENDLLLTYEEVENSRRFANELVQLRHPDHLYVPGRVLLLYQPWLSSPQDSLLDGPEQKDSKETEPSASFRCLETIATSDALRLFELDGTRIFGDHVTSSYERALAMVE